MLNSEFQTHRADSETIGNHFYGRHEFPLLHDKQKLNFKDSYAFL